MTQAKTLDDLFHDTLKDIYFAVRKSPLSTAARTGRVVCVLVP